MKTIELSHPSAMSARARAAEIASILAAVLIRTHSVENKAHSPKKRPVGLDFMPGQSVHTTPYQQEL